MQHAQQLQQESAYAKQNVGGSPVAVQVPRWPEPALARSIVCNLLGPADRC
jgi:hypothetical protein